MIIVKGRELLIPENERYIGTTYDDNSTVRTFRIPRFHEDGMDKSQLDFYVIINYDDGSDPDAVGVVKAVNDDYIVLEWDVGEDITEHSGCLYLWVRGFDHTGTVRWSSFPGVFYIETSGTEPSDLSDLEERISEEDKLIRLAKLYKSQPMTAATAAEMIDREQIYVYVGDEEGYQYGHWYFWDGSSWVPGGVYNSIGLQTDKELIAEDVAADAKAVGDELTDLKNALNDEVTRAESAEDVLQEQLDFINARFPACATLAHRGYRRGSTWARDNSAMAYVDAFVYGFKGFECDVREDKNGVLVCLHDETVDSLSSSSGAISDLSYADVTYVSDIGVETNTKLTTVACAVGIARDSNGFILFDMGKNVATIAEVVTICEAAKFYNYGFYNVTPESDLATAPDYALKVWGNEIFTHTETELQGYLAYGTKNNAVRLTVANLTEAQVQLIKSLGFKILMDYTETSLNISVNQSLLSRIDYTLGDFPLFSAPHDKSKHSGTIAQNVALDTYLSGLGNNSVRHFQILSTHPDNSTGRNLQCTAYMQGTTDYIQIVGVSVRDDGMIYKRVKYAGAWGDWIRVSKEYNLPADALANATSLLNIVQTVMSLSAFENVKVLISDAKMKALFPNTCANWGGAVFELHRILYGNNGYSWFAFHSRNPGNVQIINGYYNGTLVGTDVVMS